MKLLGLRFEVLGRYVSVQSVSAERSDSIPRMLIIFGLLNRYKFLCGENPQSIACVTTGKVRVVRNVASAEGEIGFKNTKNRQVCGLHPIDLPMHECPVKSKGLYMTGLYFGSHNTVLHTLRYRELDISSWGLHMTVDHELGVRMRLLGTNKPTGRLLPADAQLMAGYRMHQYELYHLKTGGTIAAQTPSCASAPDQLGTLVGADTPNVTATNQSTRSSGGGRRVGI